LCHGQHLGVVDARLLELALSAGQHGQIVKRFAFLLPVTTDPRQAQALL